MGTCLICHRKTRNGQKFCDSCKQKRKNRADESYLDSLLNSVGVKDTVTVKETVAVKETPEEKSIGYTEKLEIPDNNRTESLEMDGMLSDIFEDMDATESLEQPEESDLQADDIEGIFDEAEAYAALLNRTEADYSAGKTVSDPAFSGNPDNNVTVALSDVNETASDNSSDNFVDINWKNDYDPVPGENPFSGSWSLETSASRSPPAE